MLTMLAPFSSHAQELTGDPANGETVFRKCMSCHRVGPDARNMVGPALNGVVGRQAGSVADFNYSDAMKNSGITWDAASLDEFLAAPREVVQGTKMVFPGLPDAQDRTDVIAYLAQFDEEGNMTAPAQ
ncbi:c-type cytochrome [Devosia nitrariae]|nr:cytochrome c family protein [Devosia nitrariae]